MPVVGGAGIRGFGSVPETRTQCGNVLIFFANIFPDEYSLQNREERIAVEKNYAGKEEM
jgi:hypothetical protein